MKYSIVIPVFNSVQSLKPLYLAINDLMCELNETYEVIFVEDNGLEETWHTLLALKKQFPETINLIKLTKNFGQNGATLCGIDNALGDVIITIDDDLQVHPSELKKLITCYKENNYDVIYGVYKEETQHVFRNIGSKLIKHIFKKADGGANIGSSIRLINTTITKHLRHHSQDHLFINQVISWYTFDAKFIEVERNLRYDGKSGYSFWKLASIAFRLLFLYTSIPLKIMIAMCIIGSVGSLLLASYYIYQHFYLGNGLGFLALIVIAISMILASISIMGIYINRIYAARVKKPHYAIKVKL
jgi:polyisoprenyl-phosphate glycosyltransferase